MLTWSDGRTIVANGAEVHAFQATTTQFVDPTLFNTASQWSSNNNWANDPEIVPTAWREQFGGDAVTYLREIAGVSSSRDEFNDLVQRVSTIVGGGIESVTWDLDAALAATGAPAVLRALLARRLAAAGVDGAGGIAIAPKTIPYEPKGTVVLQGDAPVCGPACAAMTITDETGISISLEAAIGSFVNGVRSTGVNTLELSDVISKAGVKNTVNMTMLPEQLNRALQEGSSVIVQVPAGQGKHFIIVDAVKSVDGVSYYMTRDPYVGPRGVQQRLLDGAMSDGVNAIVIGK